MNKCHSQIHSKDFICSNCGKSVPIKAPGTHNRNHCPFCLFSKHLDKAVGDRSNICGGLMPSIAKFYKPDGEEVLVQKCQKCGFERKNRVAGDDSFEAVARLIDVTSA